jgi:hypothetical protein
MINDTTQNQSGGDSSTNIQATNIYVAGVSASEARQIALDVYKANFTVLSQEAASVAMSRAEEITDGFLKKIYEQSPALMLNLNTPGLQIALLNAQREYARTGDKSVEELLVNLLFNRASETTRNLKQIALEEAITILPKLTHKQVDILTLNLLVNDHYFMARSKDTLKYFLSALVVKFKTTIEFRSPEILHLEFTGCAKLSEASRHKGLVLDLLESFPGLFSKGFSKEEFVAQAGDNPKYENLLTPCIRSPDKLQLNATTVDDINRYFQLHDCPAEDKQKLFKVLRTNLMSTNEIQAYLIEIEPEVDFLFKFDNSDIFHLNLTPVGVAIACANFTKKIGYNVSWPYSMRNV